MDEDDIDYVAIVLDEGEALLLHDLLLLVREELEEVILFGAFRLDKYTARRLNSDIDPIISQLETELSDLGV